MNDFHRGILKAIKEQEYCGNYVVTDQPKKFHVVDGKFYEPSDQEWIKDARYCTID